ncbi:MAG TPA: hypothetical protein VG796_12365 [Verrucomicrobiales bacterium]|nr:hypothetical protein [Verrucomicrobiales bacterium]
MDPTPSPSPAESHPSPPPPSPYVPPGRGNQPEPSPEEARETVEQERDAGRGPRQPSKVEEALRRLEDRALAAWDRSMDCVRERPLESVTMAAATGYFWNILPKCSLLSTAAKLCAALTPPALVTLGVCAMSEKLQQCRENHRRRRAMNDPANTAPAFPPPGFPGAVEGL